MLPDIINLCFVVGFVIFLSSMYIWCTVAIKYNMDNIKAYYRKAAALKEMSLYDRALQAAEQGRRQASSRPQEVSSCVKFNICCL